SAPRQPRQITQPIGHPQPGHREGGWWMMDVLLAAAIAAAAPSAPAAPLTAANDASPAMFVVRDADTTVYIFGTFHALDGRSEWFKNRVKTAFDSSGELVLETVIPEGPVQIKPRFTGPRLPGTPR